MIRLATFNVEWFSALFDDANQIVADHSWSKRHDVTKRQQLDALAHVFREIDADAVVIVEAPDQGATRSTEQALKNFRDFAGLRLDSVVTGFVSETQQEIALLYDSAKIAARHDPQGSEDTATKAPRFDTKFRMDVDVDGHPDEHVFSKPPLEVALTIKESDQAMRLVGVHVKSKAPYGARSKKAAARIAIDNRRKQLAQCNWLRARVEAHLDDGDEIIVLGDFNDGPGLDEYEKLFGKSGVEVVMGAPTPPERHLFDPHVTARLNPREAWSPATARFYSRERKRYFNALLDFVMVSRGLITKGRPEWRIWHPFDDEMCFECDATRHALLTASDHFPVTLDLDL